MALQTKRFKMAQMAMITRLLSFHGKFIIVFLALAVLSLVIVAAALGDLRFVILALMVVFIIAPMIMAFLYINYAMMPLCSFNVSMHTLSLDSDGCKLTATVFARELKEPSLSSSADGESGVKARIVTESKGTYKKSFVREIPVGDLQAPLTEISGTLFPVGRNASRGFVWIPADAFDSPADYTEFVSYLNKFRNEQ